MFGAGDVDPIDEPPGILNAFTVEEPLTGAVGTAVDPLTPGAEETAACEPSAGVEGSPTADGVAGPETDDAAAARKPPGVASCETFAALSLPTGFAAPTLRIPTLAATAPLAAVTKMAVAPAKVRARCLFMTETLETPRPSVASRRVKNWQSLTAKGPKIAMRSPRTRVSTAVACHPCTRECASR